MKKPPQISHVKDLKPDDKNARRHNPRNVGVIVDALHQVGAARSIVVDENGVILAGNATVEAAGEAGITKVKVVEADGNELVAVRRTGLTEEQKRRLSLYDNRAAELAEWDETALAQLIKEGVDTKAMWTDEELTALLSRADGDEPLVEAPEAQVDRGEELRQKWGVELGQVWECGRHRIVCGDCTDKRVVEAVMREGKAAVFCTDPPYGCNAGNIGFTAERDDIEAITKDDLEGKEIQSFLELAFRACIPFLAEDCAWYLWHPMLTQGYFAAAAAAADLIIHRQIIWKKEQFIFGRGDYHWRHELCFYGWRRGNRPPFYGEHNQDTVWEVAWGEKRSEVGHPTAKPVELFAKPILNHTQVGGICLDPFLGSGTTIVACERLNRVGRGVEIDPRYVAVTLERLSDVNLSPQLVGKVEAKP